VTHTINICEHLLNDRHLRKHYAERKDDELKPYGKQLKKLYGRVVSLVDEFKAIRKFRSQQDADSLGDVG